MNLLALGTSFKTAPIEIRERLGFAGPKLTTALQELNRDFDCEAVILSTCNRVELYLAREDAEPALAVEPLADFLAEQHGLALDTVRPLLYHRAAAEAVQHLFRVASSLDSMIVGEGQIAGQVKKAYEFAQEQGTVGPVLHSLFQQGLAVAKRVRTNTGIGRGHVSVSSVAVDYVRQVFDHFHDKTILVIGAGKMGELTLRHLRDLEPHRILVANRSPDKARSVAQGCGGLAVAWEDLDNALAQADIVLSTTGAAEPIVTLKRFAGVLARRKAGTMVILDIAVPRDFDPLIHDGDRACLFNVDDLNRIREQTIEERHKHLPAAENIIAQEVRNLAKSWQRRCHGPVIARLTESFETRRRAIIDQLLHRLNGKLTDADRTYIEGAFRLLQNQLLHGPISALAEDAASGERHTLLEALRKLFHLEE